MILTKVTISNFRSIVEMEIKPGTLTTLIGKHSCGKSNILKALQFFFSASAKSAVEEDICKFSNDAGTWVECEFSGLSEENTNELAKYIRHDGTIRVRRTLYEEGQRCFTKLNGYVQRPTEPWLQDGYEDYDDMDKWKKLGIDIEKYAPLGSRGRLTKEGFKAFQQTYIAKNAPTLRIEETLSDTEFKGRQATAASILPHFIFVPAVGDIVSVIYGKQSSLLNEMVEAVIEAGKGHPDYAAAQASLAAAQEFVNPSTKRLPMLSLIEGELAKRLSSWPGTRVTIRTEVEELAKILVSGLILSVDDGQDTQLSDKGDGIQRQILFRVFQLYADFRARRGIFKSDREEAVRDRGPSIIAFEEPELFLHPQAQEAFYDDLVTVAKRDQVLLATHSSHLVRLEDADSLHIIRRESSASPTKFQTAAPDWLDTNDRERLKDIGLCSGEISKIFFADRVVVTEGQEDVIYILGTARDHASCLDRRVTVVQVGGKHNIPRLQRVLNAFGIPYIIACDLDPGDQDTADNRTRIRALIDEANKRFGTIAQEDVYDPNIPEVCHGKPPTAPKTKYDPYDALTLIRTGKPTAEFEKRVRSLFEIK